MKNKDTNIKKITEYVNGCTLYRCINGGGTEYSYIEDSFGNEIYSTPTDDEAGMLLNFLNTAFTKREQN